MAGMLDTGDLGRRPFCSASSGACLAGVLVRAWWLAWFEHSVGEVLVALRLYFVQ